MTKPAETRIHQEVDLQQQCRNSDAAIQTAMDAASKKAADGMAPELLKQAGFAYGQELYQAQSVIENLDAASPVKSLTKQQQMALASQGNSWLPRLVEEAEVWLADGRPRSEITPRWAETKVKAITVEATAERKRHVVSQPKTADIISALKREKEDLAAEREKLAARLEQANRIIAIQAAKLQEQN